MMGFGTLAVRPEAFPTLQNRFSHERCPSSTFGSYAQSGRIKNVMPNTRQSKTPRVESHCKTKKTNTPAALQMGKNGSLLYPPPNFIIMKWKSNISAKLKTAYPNMTPETINLSFN